MTIQAPPPPHAVRSPKRGPASAAFLREFLRHPAKTASVVPSSPALAKQMLSGVDLAACRAIVEYGPGTGVFTEALVDRLPPRWLVTEGGRGKFVAIEFNERFAELVRDAHPRVKVVHDDAANVGAICRREGMTPGEIDLVISGLGFASFPEPLTTRILQATWDVLKPGGSFRTFSYHVSLVKKQAWHFRAEARRVFSKVEISRVVWANVPPAFVYMCTK